MHCVLSGNTSGMVKLPMTPGGEAPSLAGVVYFLFAGQNLIYLFFGISFPIMPYIDLRRLKTSLPNKSNYDFFPVSESVMCNFDHPWAEGQEKT